MKKETLESQRFLVNKKEIKTLNKILTKLYGKQYLSKWLRSTIKRSIQEYNDSGTIQIQQFARCSNCNGVSNWFPKNDGVCGVCVAKGK
jgi:hypothetical protein